MLKISALKISSLLIFAAFAAANDDLLLQLQQPGRLPLSSPLPRQDTLAADAIPQE
ncbi:hypothetical protein OMR58_23535 [Erwinia sp. INIA-01]|uniref:hypothetical protein n=1 Tax=Erwinia sp. INIA01 TaxID=2991500 RepID=UPI0022247544|nr:hypothetical protein [Erwinia sp. INIA01]MCW1877421.1 hypothetical protein [Erwinia sp. INIA01]